MAGRAALSLPSKWQYGRIVPMPPTLPSGWELVQLTTLAKLESGHTPSRKHPEYWNGTIPWVSLHDSKNLDKAEIHTTSQTIGELGLANSSARLLPAGTVVFSRTATVGKATILGREMATSQDFANYVCGPRIHNRYLMQLLRFLQPEWTRLMAGSTHNTIYMPVFEKLQLLLPSLGEQRKIADILASIDNAIEATQVVVDQLQVVKKAVLSDLLADASMDLVARLGDVLVETYRYPSYYGIEYVPVGVPEVRGELIQDDGHLDPDLKRYRCIAPSTAERFPRTRLSEGDFVMSVRGTVGKVAIVPPALSGANITANLIRLAPDRTRVASRYLKHVLLSDGFQAELQRACSVTTIKTIQVPALHALEIPLMDLSRQQRLADILDAVDASLIESASHREQLTKVKWALMSQLLTGEVRVNTDKVAA